MFIVVFQIVLYRLDYNILYEFLLMTDKTIFDKYMEYNLSISVILPFNTLFNLSIDLCSLKYTVFSIRCT